MRWTYPHLSKEMIFFFFAEVLLDPCSDSSGSNPVEKSFKIVVVGDAPVGKTDIILTLVKGEAPAPVCVPTVYENYEAELTVDGVAYKLDLHDTAGMAISI